MTKCFGLLLVVLLTASGEARDQVFNYFHPEEIGKYGCRIQQRPVSEHYLVVVFANPINDMADSYTRVYSERPRRDQAMSDCNKWMSEVAKEIKNARAVSRDQKETH